MARLPIPGGWRSIRYTFSEARNAGGVLAMFRALRTKNTCKTCAVGMGGQAGGMVNESGHFPEFCKKSVQAMAADMQQPLDTAFWASHPIQRLASMTPRQLERSGRLALPVWRAPGADHYSEISWDDALEIAAEKLATTSPDASFFYFSGRSSNEAGFLLHLFARLYGTNNVNNCSYYCHQASGVGLSSVTGSGTATVVLEDLDRTDLVLVIGANPASNHPRLLTSLMKHKRRGGRVVVINPIRERGLEKFSVPSDPRSLLFGSRIADRVIQPHIGGDCALLLGVAKELLSRDEADRSFIAEHTNGFETFESQLNDTSWDAIEAQSGCSRDTITELTDEIVGAERVIFSWAMGVTHHHHGTQTVQTIAALALMRGLVGKPGSGLMPIRGHSNVQGIGSIGVTPTLKKAIFDGLKTHFNLDLPESKGMDTMACMEATANGQVHVGICLGGNLYGSNPDSEWASRALSELDLQVSLSTTLNTGHGVATKGGHLILPVLARDEEPHRTTQESMFNFVRMSDGGAPRFEGPRSEIDVIADLAARVHQRVQRTESSHAELPDGLDASRLAGLDWSSMSDTEGIRAMIAAVVPGWGAVGNMDAGGPEFQIDGRTFHTPRFATEDGRARFHSGSLPHVANASPDELRLMTIRSEGQFNTVVYEEHDLYRGTKRRDIIMIHPDDAASRGLNHGDRVTVSGPGGRMPHQQIHLFDRIRPGNAAMYFPEANVLLDHKVDQHSRTPAFKGALVTLS